MQKLLLAAMILCAVACSKQGIEPVDESASTPAGDAKVESVVLQAQNVLNLSYGSHAQQKIDLYLPAGRSRESTKLMILIHGGGWKGSDKADFTAYLNGMKSRLPGYAFANINHRLYAYNVDTRFPAQENDVKAAIDFLLSKQNEYNFSSQIVILGASSGAHLALLQGYKYGNQVRPRALISFFAPTDLVYLYTHPVNPSLGNSLVKIIGTTPQQDASMWTASSPIHYLTPQSAPTLLLHGTSDPLVPIVQSNMLVDRLRANGVRHELVVYEGASHSWTGERLEDSFNKIAAFLQTNVP